MIYSSHGGGIPRQLPVLLLAAAIAYVLGAFNLYYLRELFNHSIATALSFGLILNAAALLSGWSLFQVSTIPVTVKLQTHLRLTDPSALETLKEFTKKSNAINQTRRLLRSKLLVSQTDGQQVPQNHLAYVDDLTDILDDSGYQQIQARARNDPILLFTEHELNNFDAISDVQQEKYCFKCEDVKPIRAHHCKICNRCINRMDHHCIWVGNCIGKLNHKFFMLFLFYTSIAQSLITTAVIVDHFSYDQIILKSLSNEAHQQMTAIASLCGVFCIVLTAFLAFHLYLASVNLTSVEYEIPEMSKQNPFVNQFSTIENLKQVLGESIITWMLPWVSIQAHIPSHISLQYYSV